MEPAIIATLITAIISAAGAILAAIISSRARTAARGAEYQLQNGTRDDLAEIKSRLSLSEKRNERIERKVDRAHARLNDHIDLSERRFNEYLEWRSNQ